MRFSPDGSKLAVGTDVGVWLYDVSDGNATALFTDKPCQVNALAFSSDGKILASNGGHGHDDPFIQLWNLENGTKHSTLLIKREFGYRYVVALGFIGNTLISYDSSGRIISWNVSNSDILSELEKVNPNEAVTFSPTTNLIAVVDDLHKIHIYDTSLSDKHIVFQDDELKKDIFALAITSNNKKLVSGGVDKAIRIWDIEERKQITSINVHNATIASIAISHDDKIFASGDAKKKIILWDIENLKKLRTLLGHKNTVTALTFSPDGAGKYSGCLASGSLDGTIRFWNPDTGEELVTFATGHTKWIKAIAFSENGSTLVSANMTGNVDVWSLNGYQEIATFTNGESYYAEVGFTSDAKRFVCQGVNGYSITFDPYGFGYTGDTWDSPEELPLRMWDITTGEEVQGPWNENSCDILTISPDNNILAIYGSEILGWNIDSSDELFDLSTGETEILFIVNLVISSDNKHLAVYETHEKPYIWNLEKPEDLPVQTKSDINSLAFSADGNSIAILRSGNIFLHDIESFPDGEPEEIFADLHGHVARMIFSPDSKILVCTGLSGDTTEDSIKLLDMETGQEIRNLLGHSEPIETLTFSHDGKILASGSYDGTVLLWDWEKISKRQ